MAIPQESHHQGLALVGWASGLSGLLLENGGLLPGLIGFNLTEQIAISKHSLLDRLTTLGTGGGNRVHSQSFLNKGQIRGMAPWFESEQ
jgi:hypothetical protein